MTAYLVLRDHPLKPDENGPSITMTQTDLDDFETDTVEDEANAKVTVGEVLTEHQLLEGLLVHSANNFADTLGALGRRRRADLCGQNERDGATARHAAHALRRPERVRRGFAVDGRRSPEGGLARHGEPGVRRPS